MSNPLETSQSTKHFLNNIFAVFAIFCFTFILLSHSEIKAAQNCRNIFTSEEDITKFNGGLFLHQRDSRLHTTTIVEKYANRTNRSKQVRSVKPADKIEQLLLSLEKLSLRANGSNYTEGLIKEALRREFVMTSDQIPESYYNAQVRIARERGHGDRPLTSEQKMRLVESVISDQKKSLDSWTEYLISKDTQMYPMWLKYWMFTGMTKLSKFDMQSGSFGHRSKETVAPFPELNREALAYVADAVLKKVKHRSLKEIQDPAFLKLLDGFNFGKLYGAALVKIGYGRENQFPTNDGRWIIYKRGSDPTPLVQSLEGRNTGWCTAGEATAKSQLEMGDFHVYYSLDRSGQAVLPRIAVRLQNNEIAEVRGVGKNQNLDDQIQQSSVLKQKIAEFGDNGKSYEVKESDMRLLTQIEVKTKLGQSLNKEEIRFLYELDRPIQGFGYEKDPRIKEIQNTRDNLVQLYDNRFTKEEISLTPEEAISGRFKLHHGDLDLPGLLQAKGLNLPEIVMGNVFLNRLQSAEGLRLPKIIKGGLYLTELQSADGLRLPETVSGILDLSALKSINGLKFPKLVGLDIYLNSLRSAQGLELPHTITGILGLPSLETAEGIRFPETVNGDVYLKSLRSATGLKLPSIIRGILDLRSLQSARDLKLPEGVIYYNGPADIQK